MSPFIVQAGLTFFDEFYFHHKRGLPLWERLGHPLDTITVLACYLFVINKQPNPTNLSIYLGLAIFSCLFITKDEFIHSEQSPPAEQWLHAMLFVIHPIGLTVLMAYWYGGQFPEYLNAEALTSFKEFIKVQTIIVSCFLTYQILYWSVPWRKFKSTTNTITT